MGCIDELCLEHIDAAWPGLLLEVVITLVSFVGLAVICDDYLVPNVETLCIRWAIPEDIAGASFMALASAAPEIVVNVITTVLGTVKQDASADLGLASIIGSGMIACLLIPGLCALFADDSLELKRRPLLRDVVVYAISLACLVQFFDNGRIETHEGAILLIIYGVYLIVLVVAPRIRRWYRLRQSDGQPLISSDSFVSRSQQQLFGDDASKGDESLAHDKSLPLVVNSQDSSDSEASEYDPRSPWHPVRLLKGLYHAVEYPLNAVFHVTCPVCEIGTPLERLYPIGFVMSFAWVAVFSFVISACVLRWVESSGASMAFFGLVIVGLGAQIPDAIQSVAVAKRGYGSMAIANSLGSQVVNICVGMGLPWFIVGLSGHPVRIGEHLFLQTASFFLAGCLALLSILLYAEVLWYGLDKAKLSGGMGWVLVAAYVLAVGGYAVFVYYPR